MLSFFGFGLAAFSKAHQALQKKVIDILQHILCVQIKVVKGELCSQNINTS